MLVLGIVLTVIGLLLLLAFLLSRIRCRTETEAEIVRFIEKKHFFRGRTVIDRTPVFGYTVNGKKYTAKSDHSSSDPKKYSVGQKLTIFIDADHPESIRHGSNIGFCITGIVLALLGIFVIVLVFL